MNRMGKPFFTLIHRRKQGFTLVELIVVIAILAILAGVAIPIYSNYVKRANEASDLQLISAVNTAFAAACLEHGKDAKNVASAELTFDETGKRITGVTDVAGMDSDAVNLSFQKYFGDNSNTELRYYTKDDIHYNSSPDPLAGTFSAGEGSGGAAEPLVYTDSNGQKVYYTAEQILAYKNSHYNFEGATEQWTETVDSLVGAVGSNATTVASLRGDAAFRAFLTADGVDAEHATGEELGVALVRYVASKVSGLDAAAVVAAIGSDDMTTNLQNLTKLISGKEYNQAAFSEKAVAASLLFAVSGGYDGSDERLEDETFMVIDDECVSFNEAKVSDLSTFLAYMNTMDRTYYKQYLANSATADVEGLLAVMQLVNGNSDVAKLYTSNASEGHYYSNDNVIDLISGLLAAVPED